MQVDQFGPFANVVALASALVALFSTLLLKMIGGLKRWSWLAGGSPSFLVGAGARILAVALMALTYVTINKSNYLWFGVAAVICGLIGFLCVAKFDSLRQRHVVSIPLVASDGTVLKDRMGHAQRSSVVIGRESEMRPEAATAFQQARRISGVSLSRFMSGYGSPVNDPGSIWEHDSLARIGNRLTTLLMCIVLLAIMSLYLAAFTIEAANRNVPSPQHQSLMHSLTSRSSGRAQRLSEMI